MVSGKMRTFASQNLNRMIKRVLKTVGSLSAMAMLTAVVSSCASEYTRVYKSTDYAYRYEYAKQCYAEGKFQKASSLLQDMVAIKKGTSEAEEALYMLGMSEYLTKDYESAAHTFKKYFASYPKGFCAEQASFYVGQSLYESAPEPRLDQTPTIGAINAYQQFMDFFPASKMRPEAQRRLYELQDKLVQKELLSAKLYFNLGGYFGNVNSNTESNYISSIVTAQNALKTYPYSKWREDFALLIVKSKYQLAENSTEEKRLERYRDAEDECYGFINEYPDSKDRPLAEKYIAKCKKMTGEE